MGASGSGKTYLSNALGVAACRNYLTVRYVRIPVLLNELALARGEGIYLKLIKAYQKVSLLIIDEFLLTLLTNESRPTICWRSLSRGQGAVPSSSVPNSSRTAGMNWARYMIRQESGSVP